MIVQSKFVNRLRPRLSLIERGRWMVISDLHGDGDAYAWYRDHFLALKAAGKVDGLICLGDLIHADKPYGADQSIDMVIDLLDLQAKFPEQVIYLCGNHEMPHIYHIPLSKGRLEYTAPFEQALSRSGCRTEIITAFQTAPFYVSTVGGITFTHAGAAVELAIPQQVNHILDWDHHTLLNKARRQLEMEDIVALQAMVARMHGVSSYPTLSHRLLAIDDPTDPRFNDLLLGLFASSDASFNLLWSALFTQCEFDYTAEHYHKIVQMMLHHLSSSNYARQRVMVSGHIKTDGGYKIVNDNHLRIASWSHARPRSSGRYLIIDAVQTINTAADLLPCLHSINGP